MIKLINKPHFVYFFYIIVIFLLFFESITFPGVISDRIFLSPQWLAVGFILYGIMAKYKYKAKFPKYFFNINGLILLLSLVFTFILISLEASNYPNFVFSLYGIHYHYFSHIFLFSLTVGFLQIDKEIWQKHNKKIVFSIPFILLVVGLILNSWPNDFFIILNQEDNLIENLQAILFLSGSILTFILSLRYLKLNKKLAVFLIFYSLALFFVFGEEISWGQRIFGLETSPALKEVNLQDEITVHNMKGIADYIKQGYTAIGIFGSIAWIFRKLLKKYSEQFFQNFKTYIDFILPRLELAPYFFSVLVYQFFNGIYDYRVHQFSEYKELILALGIFIMVLKNYYDRQKNNCKTIGYIADYFTN